MATYPGRHCGGVWPGSKEGGRQGQEGGRGRRAAGKGGSPGKEGNRRRREAGEAAREAGAPLCWRFARGLRRLEVGGAGWRLSAAGGLGRLAGSAHRIPRVGPSAARGPRRPLHATASVDSLAAGPGTCCEPPRIPRGTRGTRRSRSSPTRGGPAPRGRLGVRPPAALGLLAHHRAGKHAKAKECLLPSFGFVARSLRFDCTRIGGVGTLPP